MTGILCLFFASTSIAYSWRWWDTPAIRSPHDLSIYLHRYDRCESFCSLFFAVAAQSGGHRSIDSVGHRSTGSKNSHTWGQFTCQPQISRKWLYSQVAAIQLRNVNVASAAKRFLGGSFLQLLRNPDGHLVNVVGHVAYAQSQVSWMASW